MSLPATRQRRAGRVPRPAAPDRRRNRRSTAAPSRSPVSWSWRCTRRGLGYYSGGAAKLGAGGRLYDRARDHAAVRRHAGAGGSRYYRPKRAQYPRIRRRHRQTGARRAHRAGAQPASRVDSYAIVELSGELRARQQEALRDFPQVRWLDGFPDVVQRRGAGQRGARRDAGRTGQQDRRRLARADGHDRGRRASPSPSARRTRRWRPTSRARCRTPTTCRTAT